MGLSRKGTNSVHELHPHDLLTSQRPYLQIPPPWGLRSTKDFKEDTNIQSVATCEAERGRTAILVHVATLDSLVEFVGGISFLQA